ncbi:MAG: CRISPR-associated endonuclease Cas2 [Armatimonadota bacterium]|nr:CRISPR-associated endonuclease Cas2 [Armatimonadota bacterium]
MYVVVCYDISDNRRRTRLHELLLGYGNPVQESVFECQLTQRQLQKLRDSARRYARKPGESIRYYLMCGSCQKRTQADGTPLVEAVVPRDFVA